MSTRLLASGLALVLQVINAINDGVGGDGKHCRCFSTLFILSSFTFFIFSEKADAATVPEETNQREETTQESPVVVEEKQANTEVDVKPTESKPAEPDVVFFPDEEDNKLAEEGDEEDKAPIEEDLKFTEDIETEDQAEEDIENED
ncbi:hypothetical protein FH972_011265 [Carpinus fangiana]|uniref:Uncharacterized protein n=1 Tax=Carpinus fangiana TaxID=176857 RepID=A0A660KQV1_9ROSI|nr:hypothetical protein FH972_011265 [Carpinus fangiana]